VRDLPALEIFPGFDHTIPYSPSLAGDGLVLGQALTVGAVELEDASFGQGLMSILVAIPNERHKADHGEATRDREGDVEIAAV
jgi:hypothetical protein